MITNLPSLQTLGAYLSWASHAMRHLYFGHGTNNAWDEACYLAIQALDLPVALPKSLSKRPLSVTEARKLYLLTQKRIATRLPLPYLTKIAYFHGLKFQVNEHVLVPRSPFAEFIKQKFAPWAKKKQRILELGTGSGALAILCSHYLPNAQITATDISKSALKVAQKNILQHKCKNITLCRSNWFAQLPAQKYDIIFTNPPYVLPQEYQTLPKEYRYEPKGALVASNYGLQDVLQILEHAQPFLTPQGMLFVETGTAFYLKKYHPKLPIFWLNLPNSESTIFGISAADLKFIL